jgi:hypothetical protein
LQQFLSTFISLTQPTALQRTISTEFASVILFSGILLNWYTRDGHNLLFSLFPSLASAGRRPKKKKLDWLNFQLVLGKAAFGPETGFDSTTGWRDLLPTRSIRCRTSHLRPTDNTLSFVKTATHTSAEWEERAEGEACMVFG